MSWNKVKNPDGWKVETRWVEEETSDEITVEKENVTEIGLPDEYMYVVKAGRESLSRLYRTPEQAVRKAEEIIAKKQKALMDSGFDWNDVF